MYPRNAFQAASSPKSHVLRQIEYFYHTGMKFALSDGNVYVTITSMAEVEVREYLDPAGRSPFAHWFAGLNAVAAAKITVAITRLEGGNFSNVKGVGGGVFEYKSDFGPGYRVYFGKDGNRLLILLGGSSKKSQGQAIAAAQVLWAAYKKAKARKDGEKWR